MEYFILFLPTIVAVALVSLLRSRLTKTVIDLLSGFTGAFVLGILVFHMLPDIYESALPVAVAGLCIMAGLLVQSILDFYTKGIDHGHTHTSACTHSHHSGHGEHAPASQAVTIGLFISLFLHTFLESTPILAGHAHSHSHGTEDVPLLYSIALHTLPMAVVLYLLVSRSVRSRAKGLLLMTAFGLSGPLGMLIGAHAEILHRYYPAALAVVAGILLHVSSVMLFDCDMAVYGKLRKLGIIILGFAGAMLVAL